MTELQIGWTNHFAAKFHSAIYPNLIIARLRELVEIVTSGPHPPIGEFTKSKPITSGPLGSQFKKNGYQLREMRLNYASRLLYSYRDEKLDLIEFDATPAHSIVDELNRWRNSNINRLIESLHPADQPFIDEVLGRTNLFELSNIDGETRNQYAEELFDDWLLFLDEPQQLVRDAIVEDLTKGIDGYKCTLILGGPGTGKTAVISSIAYQLNTMGIDTKFEMPPGVREQVRASGGFAPNPSDNWDIFLLDDPISLDDLFNAISEARKKSRQLVVAIDPTQWQERKTIERFDEFLSKELPQTHELRLAYRQGGIIGRSAINAVGRFLKRSSAYSDQKRRDAERSKAKKWETLCLREIDFATNDGTFITVNSTTDGNYLSQALKAFRLAAEFGSERSWPNVLVAVADEKQLPPGIKTLINAVKHRYPNLSVRMQTYRNVKHVRGTEFEAVIMFISKQDWDSLQNGLIGAGTAEWERTSQLLTFFTRAENVLAVLPVLEDLSSKFEYEINGKSGELRTINKIFGSDMSTFTKGTDADISANQRH